MDFKRILMGVLVKAYNIDQDGEIGKLLNNADGSSVTEDEVIDKLLKLDVERVDTIKNNVDSSGKFQEGYAKAKKEVLQDFEKQLKEKYQIESDKIGTDLIDDLINEKIELVKDKTKLTDENVKKHPVFQQMESRLLNKVSETEQNYKEKIQNLESEFNAKQTFGKVKSKALDILEGMNPILPKDTNVAKNQKGFLVNVLKDYQFEDTDGKLIALKDGKVVQDEHGNTISFENLVKNKAKDLFEFKKHEGGSNDSGADNNQSGKTANVDFKSMNANEAFKVLEQKLSEPNLTMEAKNELFKSFEEVHGTV